VWLLCSGNATGFMHWKKVVRAIKPTGQHDLN
jgi:hypothetical protein